MTPALVAALLAFCSAPPCLAQTRVVAWNGNWAFACGFKSEPFSQVRVPPEQCGPTCNATPGCTHFTWKPEESQGTAQGICQLMGGQKSKSDAVYDATQGVVCGVRDSPSPGDNWNGQAPRIRWNGDWAMSCSFSSFSFQSLQIQGDECGPRCSAVSRCTHFTWTKESGGTCKLMTGRATKTDAIPVPDPNAVCGVKNAALSWTNENWARGCYFQEGKELQGSRSTTDSADKCRLACLDDLECTHFAWKDKTCRLMGGSATEEDASVSNDPNMICGLMTCLASSLKSLGVAWSLVVATVVFYVWFG